MAQLEKKYFLWYSEEDLENYSDDEELSVEHWNWIIVITLSVWIFSVCVFCFIKNCKCGCEIDQRRVTVRRRSQQRQRPQGQMECLQPDDIKRRIIIEVSVIEHGRQYLVTTRFSLISMASI